MKQSIKNYNNHHMHKHSAKMDKISQNLLSTAQTSLFHQKIKQKKSELIKNPEHAPLMPKHNGKLERTDFSKVTYFNQNKAEEHYYVHWVYIHVWLTQVRIIAPSLQDKCTENNMDLYF